MARTPTPQIWARIRAELGVTPAVAVVPRDNILIGQVAIMNYLQIKEHRVLERWIDDFALPVVKRPDGLWMSSITAIDQWIMMAARIEYGNKARQGKTFSQRRQARAAQWQALKESPSSTEA